MNDSVNAGQAEYVPEAVFIVGGDESGSRSTCLGDSGSPVVLLRESGHWEIIGMVSWSKGCGRKFRPSVWTRVERYVDWIIQNIEHNDHHSSHHNRPVAHVLV